MKSFKTGAVEIGTSVVSALTLFLLAPVAYAQSSGAATLNLTPLSNMVAELLDFINSTLVPLIFAIAFIVFLWGVFQYFIAGGANEEQRDKGKQLVGYGLIGFFVMIAVWGIVNILLNTFGLYGGGSRPPLPTFGGATQSSPESTTQVGNPFSNTQYAPTQVGNPMSNTQYVPSQTGNPMSNTQTTSNTNLPANDFLNRSGPSGTQN